MNKRVFCATRGSHGSPAFVMMWLGHWGMYLWIHTIHYLITANTMQFRHICDNASMTAVVLYQKHDLLGNIHYWEEQSRCQQAAARVATTN